MRSQSYESEEKHFVKKRTMTNSEEYESPEEKLTSPVTEGKDKETDVFLYVNPKQDYALARNECETLRRSLEAAIKIQRVWRGKQVSVRTEKTQVALILLQVTTIRRICLDMRLTILHPGVSCVVIQGTPDSLKKMEWHPWPVSSLSTPLTATATPNT